MKTNAADDACTGTPLPLTKHARARMNERRVTPEAIVTVKTYGRVAHVRGAEIYAVGRKEVKHFLAEGVDLRRVDGLQVVCSPDGSVLTVSRNSNFRGLRQRSGRRSHRLAA